MKMIWLFVRIAFATATFSAELFIQFLLRAGFLDFFSGFIVGAAVLMCYMLMTMPIGKNKLAW